MTGIPNILFWNLLIQFFNSGLILDKNLLKFYSQNLRLQVNRYVHGLNSVSGKGLIFYLLSTEVRVE